jgi:thiol-disulfide isomerase/thioredoxin
MKPENNAPQSFWTLTRIGLLGSAILLIAAIASALYQKDDQPAEQPAPAHIAATRPSPPNNAPAVAVPNAAPANPPPARDLPANLMQASFDLLNGRKKKLADYSGKVLIVDLWATWCGPCRQEIPHLVEFARQYKSKGVEVIGLTNENPVDDAQVVKDFVKQFKINYPIGWADAQMQIGLMNGRAGIPQTLIIGRDGKIRNHFIGFSAPVSVPQMKAALDEAVAAPAGE